MLQEFYFPSCPLGFSMRTNSDRERHKIADMQNDFDDIITEASVLKSYQSTLPRHKCESGWVWCESDIKSTQQGNKQHFTNTATFAIKDMRDKELMDLCGRLENLGLKITVQPYTKFYNTIHYNTVLDTTLLED